jgi:predicted nucleic acid-binding protein
VKIILDTNVFISGVFFSGPPRQILNAWRDGKIQLVISQEILREYCRVGEVFAEEFPSINLQPILDELVKSRISPLIVIPAKAGIQLF